MSEALSRHLALPPRTRRFSLLRGQVAACRRELSNLLGCDEHHLVAHFARIAVDTTVMAGIADAPLWAAMDPQSARCPTDR